MVSAARFFRSFRAKPHFFYYPGFRYAPPWAKLPRAFGA